MLKAIAASLLGKKPADRVEVPQRVLARREIERLFQDDLAAHCVIKPAARKSANPSHA